MSDSSKGFGLLVSLIFIALAVWHFAMAVRPTRSLRSAVPSVDGKPLFTPSRRSTIAVGVALVLCAALVASAAGFLRPPVPPRLLSWACFALALGLAVRAVGDFRYVGFFKRVRGSRFAKLDSLVYSPLCLLLAVGVAIVAQGAGI